MQIITAVILAGGKGSRMGKISDNLAKAMIPICGRPTLGRQLDWLKREGIQEVIVLAGYLAPQIIEFAKTEETPDFKIHVIQEDRPLGTAGALAQLVGKIKTTFLCLYGDLVLDLNLSRLQKFHEAHQAELTLVTHPNDHPHDSDLVQLDSLDEDRVLKILSKPHKNGLLYKNLVNAAVYVMDPKLLSQIGLEIKDDKRDLAKDVFPKWVSEKRVYSYATPEFVKDMGTPERLKECSDALVSGQVSARNLKNPRPTIFLDRDGVLCKHVDHLSHLKDLEIPSDVPPNLRRLNQAGYLSLVVSNQPMVAKGMLSLETLNEIHNAMETEMGNQGAWLDRIFFCPHHPDAGFPGEIASLKIDCSCRKPKTGLLEIAAKIFPVDRERSWIIGDSWRDIEAGSKFGVKTVALGGTAFLKKEGPSVSPTLRASTFLEAVDLILGKSS